MGDDLVTRLRALAAAEHDDLSIGAEAAAAIELCRDDLRAAAAVIEDQRATILRLRRRLAATWTALDDD